MGKRLIIKGADFEDNAIYVSPTPTPDPPSPTPTDPQVYALALGVSFSNGAIGSAPLSNAERANVMITKATAANPVTWTNQFSQQNLADYSMIEIPSGAKTATAKCTNTRLKFGLVLCTQTNSTALADTGWVNGGESAAGTINLENYPTGFYLRSTLAYIAGGSFTNETIQSVGWSIEWGF